MLFLWKSVADDEMQEMKVKCYKAWLLVYVLSLELLAEVLGPSLLVLDLAREDWSALEARVFFFHGWPRLGALAEDKLRLNSMGF